MAQLQALFFSLLADNQCRPEHFNRCLGWGGDFMFCPGYGTYVLQKALALRAGTLSRSWLACSRIPGVVAHQAILRLYSW